MFSLILGSKTNETNKYKIEKLKINQKSWDENVFELNCGMPSAAIRKRLNKKKVLLNKANFK